MNELLGPPWRRWSLRYSLAGSRMRVGQFVYNAHPGLVDTVLVNGRVVKRNGMITTIDPQKVRRTAYESRDDIIRRAAGKNGFRLGGDWIPEPYAAVL